MFRFWVLTALALIIMPLLDSAVLAYLGKHSKQVLVNNYGVNSQWTLGGLGVIIHELSHALVAVLFLHHIDSIKLLNLHNLNHYQINTLGLVSHSYSKSNLYERLGNFFIGLAPCFMCSEVLWLIHNYFFGYMIDTHVTINSFNSMWLVVINSVMHPFGHLSLKLIIYLVLIIMIACTGYGLSKADFQGALDGLPFWIITVISAGILISILSLQIIWMSWMWYILTLWLIFLFRGIIYILVAYLLIILPKIV